MPMEWWDRRVAANREPQLEDQVWSSKRCPRFSQSHILPHIDQGSWRLTDANFTFLASFYKHLSTGEGSSWRLLKMVSVWISQSRSPPGLAAWPGWWHAFLEPPGFVSCPAMESWRTTLQYRRIWGSWYFRYRLSWDKPSIKFRLAHFFPDRWLVQAASILSVASWRFILSHPDWVILHML